MPSSPADDVLSRTPAARRRWNADDAREVLERHQSSGLSMRAFAAREGLDVQKLYRWRAQLERDSERPARPCGFVEITARPAASIEIILRCGRVLRVTEGFSEDSVRRLVKILDEHEDARGKRRC